MSKKEVFLKIGAGILLAGALFFLVFSESEPKIRKKTTTSSLSQREVGRDFDRFVGQNSEQFYSQSPLTHSLNRLAKNKNNTPDYSEFSHVIQQGLSEIKNVLPVRLEEKISKEKRGNAAPSVSLLSELEIHNRIWPLEYIKGLRRIEERLVEEGFIAEEKRNAFARDQDMYDFLLMLTEYAYANGWITAEELRNFTRGITEVLRETIEREKAALRKTGTLGAVLPKDQFFAESKPHTALIWDIIDGLSHVFSLIEPANAAWVRGADCYKDDNPLFFVPGPNLAAFCCNCGLLCTPKCKFVPDCGTGGSKCNIQYGCLNFTCAAWPNAIWDPTTGICGCG